MFLIKQEVLFWYLTMLILISLLAFFPTNGSFGVGSGLWPVCLFCPSIIMCSQKSSENTDLVDFPVWEQF